MPVYSAAMYTVCLALLASVTLLLHYVLTGTYLHQAFADAPVRVIAAAASVSVVVQSIKTMFPTLSGKPAVGLNMAGSVAGLAIAVGPQHIWTVAGLAVFLLIFTAAAGFHGITKTLTKTTAPDQAAIGSERPKAMAVALLFASFGVAGLTGCAHRVTAGAGATAPALADRYSQAATIMEDAATDAQSAQQIVINLHRGGAIQDAQYKAIQGVFQQVGVYGQQVDALIRAQASAPTIDAKIQQMVDSLTVISVNAAGVDPNTAAQLRNLVQVLTALLQKAITTLQPATGTLSLKENYLGPNHYRHSYRAASYAGLADLPAGRGAGQRERYTRATAGRHSGQCGHEVSADCRGLAVA